LALIGDAVTGAAAGTAAAASGIVTCAPSSVFGAGVLLDWRPLQSSKLPGFVYDLQKPGDARITRSLVLLPLSKSVMETKQRMETPVVYFYSESERKVDVDVRFPQGSITEWYPQAKQIGPSTVPAPPVIAKLVGFLGERVPAFKAKTEAKEVDLLDVQRRRRQVVEALKELLPGVQRSERAQHQVTPLIPVGPRRVQYDIVDP